MGADPAPRARVRRARPGAAEQHHVLDHRGSARVQPPRRRSRRARDAACARDAARRGEAPAHRPAVTRGAHAVDHGGRRRQAAAGGPAQLLRHQWQGNRICGDHHHHHDLDGESARHRRRLLRRGHQRRVCLGRRGVPE